MPDTHTPALLYALRKTHRLTQEEMAARMSVRERTYRDWEKGRSFPTSAQLHLLAESFGRSPVELMQVNLETGEFPSNDDFERFTIAICGDEEIPPSTIKRILHVWKSVFRGGAKNSRLSTERNAP